MFNGFFKREVRVSVNFPVRKKQRRVFDMLFLNFN